MASEVSRVISSNLPPEMRFPGTIQEPPTATILFQARYAAMLPWLIPPVGMKETSP
ncbi:MAG: hypothetical protein BWY88_01063 [Synergistetes bacterium ADurb.Bin520]|nr:MAG: hypothetical protein BWY88_01063 [Synergistetes bacterium ADurb.Bin520]